MCEVSPHSEPLWDPVTEAVMFSSAHTVIPSTRAIPSPDPHHNPLQKDRDLRENPSKPQCSVGQSIPCIPLPSAVVRTCLSLCQQEPLGAAAGLDSELGCGRKSSRCAESSCGAKRGCGRGPGRSRPCSAANRGKLCRQLQDTPGRDCWIFRQHSSR